MNTCEQIQSAPEPTAIRPAVVPRYHIRETEKAYVVTAFVPGTERSAVVTTVDGDNLVIEARRNNSPTPEGWRPLHLESRQADYRLVIGMDHRVNREAIVAELSQGVLTLTVPKAEAMLPRRIEIKG